MGLLCVAGQFDGTMYNREIQSPDPPANENEWVHPVIFEPQTKIQLTRSSYKLTIFVDFAPFLAGFESVQNYLETFRKDIFDTWYNFVEHGYNSRTLHDQSRPC